MFLGEHQETSNQVLYEPKLFESYTQAHLDTCFMDIVK